MLSLKAITWCVPVVGSAFISWYITSSYYQLKIADNEKKTEQVLNQALADKAKKENEFNGVLADVQSSISLDLKNLTLAYDKHRDTRLFSDTDSVHTDTANSNKDLSSNTTTTKAVSKSTCQCNGVDRAKFQRLYQQQLVIARDCDITATYYNKLIDLYNGVKQ